MKPIFLTTSLLLLAISLFGQDVQQVKCSWYHWDPYQHIDQSKKVSGLDHALVTAIFNDAGIDVIYDQTAKDTWAKNQKDVLSGETDLTGGAFATDERREIYHMSDPYRYEWNAIYLRPDEEELRAFNDIESLIAYIEANDIRVGVIDGYTYTDPEINAFIKRQEERGHGLVKATSDEDSFENLVHHHVEVVFSDRIVGAQIIWKNEWEGQVVEHTIQLEAKPIHLLIHKDTNPERDLIYQGYLESFNTSLTKLQDQGAIDDIIGQYLFPVLMNITVQTDWFKVTDLIGVVFFALAGLLIGFENRYDIFGILITTMLLSAGGGMLRDLIVGRDLVFLSTPDTIMIIIGIVAVGTILLQGHNWLHKKFTGYRKFVTKHGYKWKVSRLLVEAIALGAYTIIGVGVAIEMQLEPFGAWGPLLGCLTACGGGILASFLSDKNGTVMVRGSLDPEVSLIWGIVFSQFLIWQTHRLNPNEVFMGVIATIVGCTVSLLFIHFTRLKSPRVGVD